jgi:hypothetical protein
MSDQGEVPLVYDATEHVCATSAGAVLATPDDEDLLPTDPEQLDKVSPLRSESSAPGPTPHPSPCNPKP